MTRAALLATPDAKHASANIVVEKTASSSRVSSPPRAQTSPHQASDEDCAAVAAATRGSTRARCSETCDGLRGAASAVAEDASVAAARARDDDETDDDCAQAGTSPRRPATSQHAASFFGGLGDAAFASSKWVV